MEDDRGGKLESLRPPAFRTAGTGQEGGKIHLIRLLSQTHKREKRGGRGEMGRKRGNERALDGTGKPLARHETDPL